jgi:hypothetical protein
MKMPSRRWVGEHDMLVVAEEAYADMIDEAMK